MTGGVRLGSRSGRDVEASLGHDLDKTREPTSGLEPLTCSLQHLAVELARYASEADNAYSGDSPGEAMDPIESSRPKTEVVWVNIIASHCMHNQRLSNLKYGTWP